mmetsp:Transcript_12154/g.35254  ORF Transcript_12154/g.35254 Transcript_12154/m.35254 type:complete len:232 (-) Transcript_12154:4842-5537(-)
MGGEHRHVVGWSVQRRSLDFNSTMVCVRRRRECWKASGLPCCRLVAPVLCLEGEVLALVRRPAPHVAVIIEVPSDWIDAVSHSAFPDPCSWDDAIKFSFAVAKADAAIGVDGKPGIDKPIDAVWLNIFPTYRDGRLFGGAGDVVVLVIHAAVESLQIGGHHFHVAVTSLRIADFHISIRHDDQPIDSVRSQPAHRERESDVLCAVIAALQTAEPCCIWTAGKFCHVPNVHF